MISLVNRGHALQGTKGPLFHKDTTFKYRRHGKSVLEEVGLQKHTEWGRSQDVRNVELICCGRKAGAEAWLEGAVIQQFR